MIYVHGKVLVQVGHLSSCQHFAVNDISGKPVNLQPNNSIETILIIYFQILLGLEQNKIITIRNVYDRVTVWTRGPLAHHQSTHFRWKYLVKTAPLMITVYYNHLQSICSKWILFLSQVNIDICISESSFLEKLQLDWAYSFLSLACTLTNSFVLVYSQFHTTSLFDELALVCHGKLTNDSSLHLK